MEITSYQVNDAIEVRAKGRLDGYWADHFSTAVEEIIRQGNDRIRINLSEVSYISSMGIGVLVRVYKKVQDIHGSLVVVAAVGNRQEDAGYGGARHPTDARSCPRCQLAAPRRRRYAR